METSAGDIQDQLDKFFVKVIDKFILTHANRGKPMTVSHDKNIQMGDNIYQSKLSGTSMKVVEQIINKEVEALLQILIDLYLG